MPNAPWKPPWRTRPRTTACSTSHSLLEMQRKSFLDHSSNAYKVRVLCVLEFYWRFMSCPRIRDHQRCSSNRPCGQHLLHSDSPRGSSCWGCCSTYFGHSCSEVVANLRCTGTCCPSETKIQEEAGRSPGTSRCQSLSCSTTRRLHRLFKRMYPRCLNGVRTHRVGQHRVGQHRVGQHRVWQHRVGPPTLRLPSCWMLVSRA